MNISPTRDIYPISYVKAHMSKLIKQVKETQTPIIITQNGVAVAMLTDPEYAGRTLKDEVSPEEYKMILEKIQEGEEDIKAGRTRSWESLKKELKERYDF